ncbi:hypothetical protein [Hymenobacter glacieicola]|uniref:Uncharacterized protein n=1 Tax=Hymenobacter glacieicola TaxID=1562124 RepID=A0ABQ1WMN2_9BACT|nr:hypothetical protein [Hymenobacter glacieicola]GGG35467.1 hypothetical protein GCM10011378_09660 [Hymenobacter glacieicola]
MSAVQPSFEVLKQELARLHSYTTEIGKAQEITTQVQEAAVAIVDAAETIEANHRKMLEKLQTEQLRNTNEQIITLRKSAQRQADETQGLIKKELIGLRQGAEATVQALQQALAEQPRILAGITAQHEQGVTTQTDFVRQTLTESAAALDTQFTAQIQELHQAKQDFTSSVGKQLDGLTSITDRLQVISASLTAFRDSMNAAKFADRLELIEDQQVNILKRISESQNHTQNTIQSLTDIFEQRSEKLTGEIRSSRQTTLAIQIATITCVAVAIVLMLFK